LWAFTRTTDMVDHPPTLVDGPFCYTETLDNWVWLCILSRHTPYA
jgi:hypothetical protein